DSVGLLHIDCYLKKIGINWSKCCGLCTDGGKSMSGIYSGLRARVMKIVPNINWSHCCIHRQSLASKNLPGQLKLVLNEAIKLVNFIKARSTNSRIFKALYENMMSPHSILLFLTEVRWLSRGKVLTRLFELRHEVQIFFEDHPFQLSSKLHDANWLQALAYLSDIFLQINNLNLALQKNSITIFNVSDKIKSMIKKIDFWRLCIENRLPEVFETLHNFLSENKLRMSQEIRKIIIENLKELTLSFEKYFSKPEEVNNWISNLFIEEFFQKATSLSIVKKEKLIELSYVRNEYELLSDKAIEFLLSFISTELVERAFSSYLFIKNKYRNKLNAAPDLRLYLASFDPDFKKLCNSKQGQGSH
ncbi:zinc finger BED domain-containing protein 5-like, partial [Aphis craccivora]